MADGCTDVLLGCCDEPPPPPPLHPGYYYIHAALTNRGINANPWWPAPSRTKYLHYSWHVQNVGSCAFPLDQPLVIGEISVDPDTGVQTRTGSSAGFPTKASAANTISESYAATATSLIADVVQKSTPTCTSTLHLEFTLGIGDDEMIARINQLLSACSFSDFTPNAPAGYGIWKQAIGCDFLVHTPESGCVSKARPSGNALPAAGEAGFYIDSYLGNCCTYSANRLLIYQGNKNCCFAKINRVTGAYSNFFEGDASDYLELPPPSPDLSVATTGFTWVANRGYRDPFQIFPPNTPCP